MGRDVVRLRGWGVTELRGCEVARLRGCEVARFFVTSQLRNLATLLLYKAFCDFFRELIIGARRKAYPGHRAVPGRGVGGPGMVVAHTVAFTENAEGEVASAAQQLKDFALHIGSGGHFRMVEALEKTPDRSIGCVGLPGEYALSGRRHELSGVKRDDSQPGQAGVQSV